MKPWHEWGDDSFDWAALNESINYIMKTWKKWGRIGTHGKEKYGTFRDHPYFWDGSIWQLCKPGYVWYGQPPWTWIHGVIDRYFFEAFTKLTGIRWLFRQWQYIVYNYAIQKMCKRFPHITDELVSNLEGYALVKPGIFGKVSGKEIEKKYWSHHE